MSNLRIIQKQWQANLLQSPVVDQERQAIRNDIALQLYKGRNRDSYSDKWPHNFEAFASQSKSLDHKIIAKKLSDFLYFIGTGISADVLFRHLESNKRNRAKLVKKVNQILKTLLHLQDNRSIYYLFEECDDEWFYLLNIEQNNEAPSSQLSFYDEIDLPKLYNLPINLPEGYENDPLIMNLFSELETSGKNFFITGKAGTGKSTFIHYFCSKSKKKIVKTAFTGIAAINISGETIHSFLYFPLKPLLSDDDEIITFREGTYKKKLMEQFNTLIIDEVSMLRSDILQAIDSSLRRNTGNFNSPFGGKQVILVGDVFQLPPVVENDPELREFFSEEYASEYFFDAPVYKANPFNIINLTTVHRQGSDKEFVELLDEVRACCLSEASLKKLNERCDPLYNPDSKEFIIHLTATNAQARALNMEELNKLPTIIHHFFAEIELDFPEDKFPTDPILKIKKHAQVMFIKNDKEKRWINGTIAKVEFVSDDSIEVRLQDGSSHKVEKEIWENRQYTWNRKERKITSKVIGTFKHFPLKLAWAITIHKCQGLTLDKAIIDLGRGAFSSGQVYTALSRCRTFEGIILKKRLRPEDLILNFRVIEFHKKIIGT